MSSESAVKDIGSEQGLDIAESDVAGTSLRPAASAVDQPSQNSLMAFQGEHEALHEPPCLNDKQKARKCCVGGVRCNMWAIQRVPQEACELVVEDLARWAVAAEHTTNFTKQYGEA